MNLRRLAALLPLALLAACSSIGLKQTLENEVSEMRALRSDLDASWSAVEQRVAQVERDVASFSTADVDLSGVNTEALEEDILEDVEEGAPAPEAPDAGEIYEGADADARAEVESMRTEAKRILAELRTGIPADIRALTERSAKTAVDAARIQASADQLGSLAENNPLMSDDDMASYRRNRATLDSEMTGVTGFADQVVRDSGELSQRLATALASFEAKVEGLDG